MRTGLLSTCLLMAACAATTTPVASPRLWAQPSHALLSDARPFAVGAESPEVFVTSLGSWAEPIDASGTVVHVGALDGAPVSVGVPDWLGMHELVIAHGSHRVAVQYDTPAGAAPVRLGEHVHLFAHTMRVGRQLAFSMVVLDDHGRLAMAGLRTPSVSDEILPDGWWVGFGPETRSAPLCDGRLFQRAVRVRGPGGEAVVMPGYTSVARLGLRGARYAVDVDRATEARASCDRASDETELSVVIRRLPDRTAR